MTLTDAISEHCLMQGSLGRSGGRCPFVSGAQKTNQKEFKFGIATCSPIQSALQYIDFSYLRTHA
jgi:hypothetical protein